MTNHFIDAKTDTRPARAGWAPGWYLGTCRTCNERFTGDKRASQCADCAYKEPEPEPYKPPFKFEDAVRRSSAAGSLVVARGYWRDFRLEYLSTSADVEAFIAHIRDQARKAGII